MALPPAFFTIPLFPGPKELNFSNRQSKADQMEALAVFLRSSLERAL